MNLTPTEIRLLTQTLDTSIKLTGAGTQTSRRLTALKLKVARYETYVNKEKVIAKKLVKGRETVSGEAS